MTTNTCVLCLAETDDLSDFRPGDTIAIVEPDQCERYGLQCCPYIEDNPMNSTGKINTAREEE
jgi:hypothetical protein